MLCSGEVSCPPPHVIPLCTSRGIAISFILYIFYFLFQKIRKDERLYLRHHIICFFLIVFHQEAERNRLCRRLQLKDIIPVEMQRVTKYPLLLDNIAKYTGNSTEKPRAKTHSQDARWLLVAHQQMQTGDATGVNTRGRNFCATSHNSRLCWCMFQQRTARRGKR